MSYTLIIKFPFRSVNDEKYTLALHTVSQSPMTAAKNAMLRDRRCFSHVTGQNTGDDWLDIFEGTLCGSVKAVDDARDDLFSPLCPSKLKFSIGCSEFPAWLMHLCNTATNVRAVLYTDTEALATPLRVRWRGYLLCNTLNMTVVNDLLACPMVAIDDIGLAKYMPFRANCEGRPAHLSLFALFEKYWGINWRDNFETAYTDLGLATNQAALYWQRNASIDDDDGNEVKDLLHALHVNLERYYLERDATWETVLQDVCQYIGVHFVIGGYEGNYSYDNYILASYDSGSFTTYTYGLITGNTSSSASTLHTTLGNQVKMGGNVQITFEPDKWKGAKVTSKPERPPVHSYLGADNVKDITPNAGHGGFVQTRIGKLGSGGYAEELEYWRLIYTRIVNAEDQWTDEADYVELENCKVSAAGREVGGNGYFPMTDAALGSLKPTGNDTDTLEFITEKRGMIPVKIGSFKINNEEWVKSMYSYFMLLNNVWGRKYWDDDDAVNTDTSDTFKAATLKPFGRDGSVLSAAKAFLKIDFKAMILNENIGKMDDIFETDGVSYYPGLYGRESVVFPITRSFHSYTGYEYQITGRLENHGANWFANETTAYLTVRISIGNWFYVYDSVNHVWAWNYYANAADAPLSKMPIVGPIDEKWVPSSGAANGVVSNYYYVELQPKRRIFDDGFIIPLEGISNHSHALQGEMKVEIWWPTASLNYYEAGAGPKRNNILSILIHDIEVSYTDEAEMTDADIEVKSVQETDPDSNTKELKELQLELSTPKVDGVFNNCLLYDGGKMWHNLQAIRTQGGSFITPEDYLSGMIARVYSRPAVWMELNRPFSAGGYGDVANIDFRVVGLSEAPLVTFVPVERTFDYTKGWVKWKLQQLSSSEVVV
ncbi:MAG: hypothetical protein IIZ97_07205 [Prevotella sp.]|nr:hypothetical protein [Prevotella sp.]